MKTFWNDLFNLGGIYFILSFLFPNDFIQIILFLTFIGSLITLCIKKHFKFLSFFEKHPYIETYIKCLGILICIDLIFFMIPEMIVGYQQAMAAYKGEEYYSILVEYISWGHIIKGILLGIALVVTTVLNIRRKIKLNSAK